jgi:ABC-type Fe3+-hydroxamate transport system, periplasmic component
MSIAKRYISVVFFATSALAALFSVSIPDSLGRTVEVETPRRVALLNSSLADCYLLAGGSVDITIEESVERGFASTDAAIVGKSSGMRIDAELLSSLRPDYVIGSADLSSHVDVAKKLDRLNIPSSLFRMESYEEFKEVFYQMTRVTGRDDLYHKVVDVNDKIITSLITKARTEDTKPTVLLIRSGSGFSSFKAKNAENHFAGKIISDLGAINIADEAPFLSENISLEYIMKVNPDKIFVILHGDEAAAESFVLSTFKKSGWKDLKAVKNGNFFILDKELFHYKPCERYGESYSAMYDLLYGGKR